MHDALSRYSREIYSVESLPAGLGVLSHAALELGFEGVGCVLWSAASAVAESPPPPHVLHSLDMGPGVSHWGVRYLDRGIFRHDFAFPLCRKSVVPALWSSECLPEISPGAGRAATRQEIAAMTHLRRLTGVRGAIVVPIHIPTGMFGYMSFPSKQPLPYLMQRQEKCERQLLGITHRFFDAMAARIGEFVSQQDLSPRELRCLTLMASGETIEGAAATLGLSYSTVRFHLYNADRKLGTHSRAHTIARAAALGFLGRLN